ncbi:developmental regulator VosA [Aspergillus sclerotialis]|uniref:Developmental regulator VosA n=1 Tax=Aspergillus sclerotialis TaxID=2070753 RepID=A0A3A3A624_9EURO|nr:developmental regulator VosA [Aspergillus sclerotialis]
MSCDLYDATEDRPVPVSQATTLAGTSVSSLHRLKDVDNNGESDVLLAPLIANNQPDGGFFVFGDLSVKLEGEFRLQFNLYEMRKYACRKKLH